MWEGWGLWGEEEGNVAGEWECEWVGRNVGGERNVIGWIKGAEDGI